VRSQYSSALILLSFSAFPYNSFRELTCPQKLADVESAFSSTKEDE